MRIIVNARFLCQPLSGVQRYAIECSKQIAKKHSGLVFVAPSNIIHQDISKELNVNVLGKYTGHRWEQTELPGLAKKYKADVLLNLCNTAPLLYSKSIVTIHDLAFMHHPEWNSRLFAMWYNFLIPRIAKRAKRVFTVSETIKREIAHFYHIDKHKIDVTYNGVADVYANNWGNAIDKQKLILAVGTFNKRKNHDLLIRAFLKSKAVEKGYTLVIIGDKHKVFSDVGIDSKLIENSNVKILDNVSNGELREWYYKSEIVASLSGYEGFGIPVVEALASGCKILCSEIETYKELFDGYVTYTSINNEEIVAKSINDIIDSKQITTPESVNLLLQKYSYEKAAQVILDNILKHQ